MLRNAALRIALLTIVWVVPLAAHSEAPIIRTVTGIRYEVPAGWEWTKFDGYKVTIRHLATTSGEKGRESSPNTFQIGVTPTYGDDYNKGWGKLDRDQRRTFPNGAVARWKAGRRFDLHYAFEGEAKIGSKTMRVVILDKRTPGFDVSLIESAFLSAAETLRLVPASEVLYHPSLRIAVDESGSKSWLSRSSRHDISFQHFVNGVGRSSNAHIYAYPASREFAGTGKALADITSAFEKSASLKIGEVRRADFPAGEVLWTEQPGTSRPFLAAVQRDGRHFFVQMQGGTSVTSASDAEAVREDFLAITKSVRAWDGN